MDSNDKIILDDQGRLRDLVQHEGWGVARRKFTEKIIDLQNAFNLDDSDPQKLVIDLKVRKVATEILFDFLREIEGTAQQAIENATIKKPSFVVKLED